jgi:hypothetical protein
MRRSTLPLDKPSVKIRHDMMNELQNGLRTNKEVASIMSDRLGYTVSRDYVKCRSVTLGLNRIPCVPGKGLNERYAMLRTLCDGIKTGAEIAEIMNEHFDYKITRKYVVATAFRLDLPRIERGGSGELSSRYRSGKCVSLKGYVRVLAPDGHPHATSDGYIREHRLAMEKKLGRYILPTEVVHHEDSMTLNNHPDNLMVFSSQTEHRARHMELGETIYSTPEGEETMDEREKRGNLRVIEILKAAYYLGIESEYVSHALHWLDKENIDYSSKESIKSELIKQYPWWYWLP